MNTIELRKIITKIVDWQWYDYRENGGGTFAVEKDNRTVRFDTGIWCGNSLLPIKWDDVIAAAQAAHLFENPCCTLFGQAGIIIEYDESLTSLYMERFGPFERTPEGLCLAIVELKNKGKI